MITEWIEVEKKEGEEIEGTGVECFGNAQERRDGPLVPASKHWAFTATIAATTAVAVLGMAGAAALTGAAVGGGVALLTGTAVLDGLAAGAAGLGLLTATGTGAVAVALVARVAADPDLSIETYDKDE